MESNAPEHRQNMKHTIKQNKKTIKKTLSSTEFSKSQQEQEFSKS